MRFASVAAFVVAAASLNAFPLSAHEGRGPGRACGAEKEKFCADVKRGSGGMKECLRQHASELSPGCAEAMEVAIEARRNILEACKADGAKFCATGADNDRPSGIFRCLESHAAELQGGCAAALKERPGAKTN